MFLVNVNGLELNGLSFIDSLKLVLVMVNKYAPGERALRRPHEVSCGQSKG